MTNDSPMKNIWAPNIIYTFHGFYFYKNAAHSSPEINPIAWLPANRYPVAEPWAIGNVSSAEYVVNRAVNGITKNPAHAPIMPITGYDSTFDIKMRLSNENVNTAPNRPI